MSYGILDLIFKYPLIKVSKKGEVETYEGCITIIDQRDYEIKLIMKNNSLKLTKTQQLDKFQEQIVYLEKHCKNPVEFLDGLQETIVNSRNQTKKYAKKSVVQIYRKVLSEYAEFQQFYFNTGSCSLANDLSEIKIVAVDCLNRLHELIVNVDYEETDYIFVIKQWDIPELKQNNDDKRFNSLKLLYDCFLNKLNILQLFFDVMAELDGSCWVLDPKVPHKSDIYRRISLGDNTSVIVTFDPYNMHNRPDMKFLGPDRVVDKYSKILSKNLQNWISCGHILQDIINLLGITAFPVKPLEINMASEIILCQQGECCICSSSQLNNKFPEIVCLNKSCENSYHIECLYMWLISVNMHKSMNEIYGQCPNCEKEISCPIPEDAE